MKKLALFLLAMATYVIGYANNSGLAADTLVNEIEIWPGAGPGSESLSVVEKINVRSPGGTCDRNWAVQGVTVPTITPVIPDNPNGSAIIICPGGGYTYVVYDKEGLNIAEWYNSIGVTAFVLKYRCPFDNHVDKRNVPLQDAQRAMRYVRANAGQWGLDTNKIGIMGASAGGHMAGSLSTLYDKKVYEPKDHIDSVNARPNFAVMIYPVLSMESSVTHSGSRSNLLGSSPSDSLVKIFSAEQNVTSETPPTFMTRSHEDTGVPAANCNLYYQALQDSGVVSKLKIFKTGGHGVGICEAGNSLFAKWPLFCNEWLYEQGLTSDAVEISHDAGVTDITLDPAGDFTFDVDTKEYNVVLPENTSSVTVAVTKSNDGASVSGQGKKNVSSDKITTSTITVTAQDDTTVNTYVINFDVFVGIETMNNESNLNVFPNPITSTSRIEYSVAKESDIYISIIDLTGKKIGVLENERKQAGEYSISLLKYKNKLNGFFILKFQNGNQLIEKRLLF